MPQTVPLLRILGPARAGKIAPHHALDRHHLGLAAKRRAAFQRLPVDAGGQVHLPDVGRDQVVRFAQTLEPERRDLRQHAALVRNAGRQDPIKRTQPVGAHQEQFPAQIVNVADLAAPYGQSGKRSLQNDRGWHGTNGI